jgi:hypothetical protein
MAQTLTATRLLRLQPSPASASAVSAQIPGRGGQRPGTVPHWRGIFDDDGRLMVAINFNMDMGDAWEHADDPWYPEPMTALAYRFAVNYLIYSMTH